MRNLLFSRRVPQEPKRYSLPDGLRIYAVGDIHGRRDCLLQLEDRIAAHADRYGRAGAQVIFLGDYVDRGPESRGVLDGLSARKFAGLPAQFLLGNHEDAMLHFLVDPGAGADWLAFGGLQTLASYGVYVGAAPDRRSSAAASRDLAAALPAAHLTFLQELELSILLGDYLFVHAGIRPGVALARQRRSDLLTIREPFLQSRAFLPWRVVHGHTVVGQPEILPSRIALDTGAYATGRLTCAILTGEDVELLVS